MVNGGGGVGKRRHRDPSTGGRRCAPSLKPALPVSTISMASWIDARERVISESTRQRDSIVNCLLNHLVSIILMIVVSVSWRAVGVAFTALDEPAESVENGCQSADPSRCIRIHKEIHQIHRQINTIGTNHVLKPVDLNVNKESLSPSPSPPPHLLSPFKKNPGAKNDSRLVNDLICPRQASQLTSLPRACK